MMSSGVSSMAVNSTPLAAKDSRAKNSLGKEAFLTLLVKQLQNQDPLKPMENKDFTAQLAQFSALEEMKNISKSVDGLVGSQASSSNTNAVGFIGKEVTALGGSVTVSGGTAGQLQYELEKDASIVNFQISDPSGKVVRVIDKSDISSGANFLVWDGWDSQGGILPDGGYSFEVKAIDSTGATVMAKTVMKGVVTSVKYEMGLPYLMIGSLRVPMRNVTEVK